MQLCGRWRQLHPQALAGLTACRLALAEPQQRWCVSAACRPGCHQGNCLAAGSRLFASCRGGFVSAVVLYLHSCYACVVRSGVIGDGPGCAGVITSSRSCLAARSGRQKDTSRPQPTPCSSCGASVEVCHTFVVCPVGASLPAPSPEMCKGISCSTCRTGIPLQASIKSHGTLEPYGPICGRHQALKQEVSTQPPI